MHETCSRPAVPPRLAQLPFSGHQRRGSSTQRCAAVLAAAAARRPAHWRGVVGSAVFAGCCLAGALATATEVSAVALFKDRAVLIIDGHQRSIKVGAVSPEGVRLLAADAAHARIDVDGSASELRLDGRIQGDLGRSPTAMVVRLVPGPGGHYFVDGQINGNPVQFLVDTGATEVAMNKNFARSIGVSYAVDGTPSAVETASGVVQAYRVLLNEVKVQSLRLSRVEGVVIDGDFPSTPLLGQSFLNRLDIHRAGAVLELHSR